jgi:hypothetical protein
MPQSTNPNRRQTDRLKGQLDELQTRLTEINSLVYTQDPALDAELRAIHAALPYYKEALGLAVEKRKAGKVHRRPQTPTR